jgi:transcriptional regulator with XRE-family HTH domain
MKGNAMTVAEKIRTAREGDGLTQEALARQIGVSMMTVSRWEHGMQPDPQNIRKLAAILKISVDDLLPEN